MKNKTILIICAMDVELEKAKAMLKDMKKDSYLGYDFFEGTYNKNKIIATKCGIGKVNAGALTLLAIEHFNPDLVFNSGIAGGYSKALKTTDVVIADKLVYADVDMTGDISTDLKYGQMQGLPAYFEVNEDLLKMVKSMNFDFNIYYGAIATADLFVVDYDKTASIMETHFKDLNVLACDMESCAIAQMCYLQKVPFLIVRSISDCIGSSDPFDYQNFSAKASNNAALIVKSIIEKF